MHPQRLTKKSMDHGTLEIYISLSGWKLYVHSETIGALDIRSQINFPDFGSLGINGIEGGVTMGYR